jgi:hypothetical protein
MKNGLSAIGLVLLGGCSGNGVGTEGEPVAEDRAEFSYTPTELWPPGPVSVCFMSDAFSVEANRVRTALERTWERVSEFDLVGWDLCASHAVPGTNPVRYDVDVRIQWTAENGGAINSRAGNRARLDGIDTPSMNLRKFRGPPPPGDGFAACYSDSQRIGQSGGLWTSARNYCLDVEAVHEFSHVLGGHHEQTRADRPAACTAGDGGDTVPGSQWFGVWDPTSVTNYCNPIFRNDSLLSSHDIAAAQYIYGQNGRDYVWWMFGETGRLTGTDYRGLVFNTTREDSINLLYDRPFTGDFDGDGGSDIFFYRTGSSGDNLWYGEEDQTFTSRNGQDVDGTYVPVVGRFDGSLTQDIYWYSPSSTDYVWYGRSDRTFDKSKTAKSFSRSGTFVPLAGDFDGNTYTDIFWYQAGSGADYIWWGTSSGFEEVAAEVTGTFTAFTGNFDGDGYDDIFWYRPGSGEDFLWYGAGARAFTKTSPPEQVSGTYEPIVGDFDGSAGDDIIWNVTGSSSDASTAADRLWLARSGQRNPIRTHVAILGSFVPLVGDFDDNGKTDVFWFGKVR